MNQSLGVNVRGTALTPEQKEKLEERNRYVERAVTNEASANFEEARRCRSEALKIVTELYGENRNNYCAELRKLNHTRFR